MALMTSSLTLNLVGPLVLIWALTKWSKAYAIHRKLRHIPTIGPSGMLTSFMSVPQMLKDSRKPLEEGYKLYYGRPFRVAAPLEWYIILTGPQLTSELARAPESVLSFLEASNDTLATEYTFGEQIAKDPYHADTIRTLLTRNLAGKFGELRDEIVDVFGTEIPLTKEWTQMRIMRPIQRIVCMTSNRVFTGSELCRNADYIDLNIDFTITTFKAALILSQFPHFLRPFAKRFLTNVDAHVARGMKHLGPIFEEAIANEKEHGTDWPGKPNNLVSWLLQHANTPERRKIKNLVNTMLAVNVAAIHTTSLTFVNAIYDLAVRPELLAPLREELQQMLEEEQGQWTKDGMGRLVKMDSFMKESGRLNPLGPIGMRRIAQEDFVLSDGTVIPKGASVATAEMATHIHDPAYASLQPTPESFNAFVHETQMTNTKPEWQQFGHGRHACPGRFFAVNEVKALVAHLILNYDFKMADGEMVRPEGKWMFGANLPDERKEVMFRARKIY